MGALIGIALATFNGARYISEMLDSIERQTFQYFHIHVTDDGSTDNTIAIIKSHKLFIEGKISIHEELGGVGALRNFSRAITYCNEEYILLCDQDDYWAKNKLELILKKFREIELNEGNIPLLVFSDLQIVDSSLNCIYESFFKSSIKDSRCSNPQDFLVSNHIPGCSMAINASAKKIVMPIPETIRMHDWWIALVVSSYGTIKYIDEPLVKYRQHEHNTIGAPGVGNKKFLQELMALRGVNKMIKNTKCILAEYYYRVDLINSDGGVLKNHDLKRKYFFISKLHFIINSYFGERILASLLIWSTLKLRK